MSRVALAPPETDAGEARHTVISKTWGGGGALCLRHQSLTIFGEDYRSVNKIQCNMHTVVAHMG
jgi:hypothetical protein